MDPNFLKKEGDTASTDNTDRHGASKLALSDSTEAASRRDLLTEGNEDH